MTPSLSCLSLPPLFFTFTLYCHFCHSLSLRLLSPPLLFSLPSCSCLFHLSPPLLFSLLHALVYFVSLPSLSLLSLLLLLPLSSLSPLSLLSLLSTFSSLSESVQCLSFSPVSQQLLSCASTEIGMHVVIYNNCIMFGL